MEGRRDLECLRVVPHTSETETSSINTTSTEKTSIESYDTELDDIEAQMLLKSKDCAAPEYSIPTRTKYLYLALYFTLNLVLTLYNKAVLGKVRRDSEKVERGRIRTTLLIHLLL